MKDHLKDLVDLSNRFGSNDFVTAGGGNTSWKNDEFIWVKASGTSLSTITTSGFVQLRRSVLDEITGRVYSQVEKEREEQVKADLYRSIAIPDCKLRPSVETSIHNLISYRFVIHTHPSLVNGLLCSKNAEQTCKKIFGDNALFIKYAHPGYIIFKKIEKQVQKYRHDHSSDPKIIMIENHGIFVSADSAGEIISLYEMVLSRIRKEIKNVLPGGTLQADRRVAAILPGIKGILSKHGRKVLKITNSRIISRFIKDEEGLAKIRGPLIPDHVVYCGHTFLVIDLPADLKPEKYLDGFSKKYDQYLKKYQVQPKVIVLRDFGIVSVGDTSDSASIILDVFQDMLKVTCYAERSGGVKVMRKDHIEFIQSWEVENYRRQISAGVTLRGMVSDRTIVVTGGAQGFGEGIVRDLCSSGANVVIADVNDARGKMLADQLNATGGKNEALFVRTDVSDFNSVVEMVHSAVMCFGGIDVLISNAGILQAGSIEEMKPEDFERVTSINYSAFFRVVKAVTPVLKMQTKYNPELFADIIQVNSKSGLRGSNKNFAYSGGKFGGIGLTQSFALELMPFRIKVNAVCPGNFFDGPLWSDPVNGLFVQYLKTGKVPGAKTVEDVKRYYELQVPAGRGCRVEDVMKAIYYLIDQEYETGQALPVTGGQVMMG